jgi:tetratricopeptide (TPR) repeat protein
MAHYLLDTNIISRLGEESVTDKVSEKLYSLRDEDISQIYDAQGDYTTVLKYLEASLKIRKEIGDKSGEGTTLNNISQIYDAQGDYTTALKYLEASLKISKEIGDKSGECVTLINIGHIDWSNGNEKKAYENWLAGYMIAKKIGYAQALKALKGMEKQLKLLNGFEGWEVLAKKYNKN